MLLDVNPWGIRTEFQYDKVTKQSTIVQTQNVDAILDNNKEFANAGGYKGEEGDFWHVASIPLVELEKWLREYRLETGRVLFSPFVNDEDWERWMYRRLDSSDYRALRTMHCRIGTSKKIA